MRTYLFIAAGLKTTKEFPTYEKAKEYFEGTKAALKRSLWYNVYKNLLAEGWEKGGKQKVFYFGLAGYSEVTISYFCGSYAYCESIDFSCMDSELDEKLESWKKTTEAKLKADKIKSTVNDTFWATFTVMSKKHDGELFNHRVKV